MMCLTYHFYFKLCTLLHPFFLFPSLFWPVPCIPRTSFSVCCSPTQLGPKEFRWTSLSVRPPTRPRGRQFSLQFSRQTSKASVRSLPSPNALGRRRRCLARFQSRRSPGPQSDTLQLPDPDYNQEFQGIAGTDDDDKDETNTTDDTASNTQSQSSEKDQNSHTGT